MSYGIAVYSLHFLHPAAMLRISSPALLHAACLCFITSLLDGLWIMLLLATHYTIGLCLSLATHYTIGLCLFFINITKLQVLRITQAEMCLMLYQLQAS